MAELAHDLAAPFGRRRPVVAAVGHALDFETWRSPARRQGLPEAEAVSAMVSWSVAVESADAVVSILSPWRPPTIA